MKTFCTYIIPIVIACFLCTTTDSLCYANGIGTNVSVVASKVTVKQMTPEEFNSVTATNLVLTYSTNLTDWGFTANDVQTLITNIDLSTAVVNTNTGMKEIYVTAHIPGVGVGSTNIPPYAFFKTDVVYATDTGPIVTNPDSLQIYYGNTVPTNFLSHVNGVPIIKLTTGINTTFSVPGACAGIIIAIMVVIVMGIIIYILVKTCNRLIPKK